MFSSIHPSWLTFLDSQKKQPYFQSILSRIEKDYRNKNIFPDKNQIFKVLSYPLNTISVVIIGQDPYPTRGYANGLSFSVDPSIYPYPKSLLNIFKEVLQEYPETWIENGDLTRWSSQGVFLLNTILTVQEGTPLSHKNIGWEIFTENVLKHITQNQKGIAFLLWGKNAHIFESIVPEGNLIIKTSHPSPLGFTKSGKDFISFKNSNQFSQVNSFLEKQGKPTINW
jgi:uracil-DNA glycosylase